MANAFVPWEGELYLNRSLLRDPGVLADNWYLRTFKNSFTPVMSSVRADFTESDWADYAPILLDPEEWLSPVLGANGATSFYGSVPQLFSTASASQNIYGWMVTQEDLTVLWCQLLGSPWALSPSNPFPILPVWVGISYEQPM